MARNAVLLVSTLAILGVLFVVYTTMLDDPVVPADATGTAGGDTLPVGPSGDPSAALPIAGVGEVPPGEAIEFTVYDERTGRPQQHFRCDEWTPVKGSKGEIQVSKPQLVISLPSGRTATISADVGQVTVERIERGAGEPRRGWLRGDVRIVLQTPARGDATAAEPAQRDLTTIHLEHLEFDLEPGTLHADGMVRVTSSAFELSGTGLDLVWNEADNVVESLVIYQGEQLTVFRGVGLFRANGGQASGLSTDRPEAGPPESSDGPPQKEPAAARAKRRRRNTSYLCTLSGGVVAEQFDGDQSVGKLEADQVRLLFDMSGAADRIIGESDAPGPAATQPAERRGRMVVRWNGPLRIDPQSASQADEARRHLEASGETVTLTHTDGVVQCGRLEYRDETQQIWLHPRADGRVHFSLGARLSASASSVYIDQANNIIKLIGDVSLDSQRGETPGARRQSIRCSLWAELHLAAKTKAVPTSQPTSEQQGRLLSYGQLESATFVGDAAVEIGGQTLTAQRVDARFKPGDGEQTLDTALEMATATGTVRLAREGEALECEQLALTFAVTADGELYPSHMDANGVGADRARRVVDRRRPGHHRTGTGAV